MLENILKECLEEEEKEVDLKISVDEIIRLTLGKLNNYSKYIKPSIKKVNRKRINEIEKKFNTEEYLIDLKEKMKKTFYKKKDKTCKHCKNEIKTEISQISNETKINFKNKILSEENYILNNKVFELNVF